jgi:hypothetical protein
LRDGGWDGLRDQCIRYLGVTLSKRGPERVEGLARRADSQHPWSAHISSIGPRQTALVSMRYGRYRIFRQKLASVHLMK